MMRASIGISYGFVSFNKRIQKLLKLSLTLFGTTTNEHEQEIAKKVLAIFFRKAGWRNNFKQMTVSFLPHQQFQQNLMQRSLDLDKHRYELLLKKFNQELQVYIGELFLSSKPAK